MISKRLVALLDVELPPPPDSLKSACMNLLGVWGETECAVVTPGEPAPTQHITGKGLKDPPESQLCLRE